MELYIWIKISAVWNISFGVTIYENNCIKLILFHFFMPDKVINNETEEDWRSYPEYQTDKKLSRSYQVQIIF